MSRAQKFQTFGIQCQSLINNFFHYLINFQFQNALLNAAIFMCAIIEWIVYMLPLPMFCTMSMLSFYEVPKWKIVQFIYWFKGTNSLKMTNRLVQDALANKGRHQSQQKVAIVTGANAGLGLETSISLARAGYFVVLACRNPKRGMEAASHIRSLTGSSDVISLTCDLSKFESVGEFVERFERLLKPGLDVLINNAGIFWADYELTASGIESHFTSNHLGHFLLTHLLIPSLKKKENSHIINVSSLAHIIGQDIAYNVLSDEKQYSRYRAYQNSKLANLLFTYQLSRELEGTGVRVNACHPGIVQTTIFSKVKVLFVPEKYVQMLAQTIMRDTVCGALTIVDLALNEKRKADTGKYFCDTVEWPSSPASYNLEQQEKLWKFSLDMTGIKV